MPTLHLGVKVVPYNYLTEEENKQYKIDFATKRALNRKHPIPKKEPETVDTGEVAEWLENKYHIMEAFYDKYEQQIADDIANSVAGKMESIIQGAAIDGSLFPPEQGVTAELFKKFLSSQEVERLGIEGTPTQAALEGRSHRFKSGYAPSGRRPSFIDTGLYQASMTAWVDDNGSE